MVGLWRRIQRSPRLLAAVVLLALGGCALDEEATLRSELGDWLHLGETRHFTSKGNCTAGIFDLARTSVRVNKMPIRALTLDHGLVMIRRAERVMFDLPGVSPNAVSEGIMSRDLSNGLGLLSNGVGPALSCLEDEALKRGVYRIMTSGSAKLVYDPNGNALVLIYPPEKLAVFLRGNV